MALKYLHRNTILIINNMNVFLYSLKIHYFDLVNDFRFLKSYTQLLPLKIRNIEETDVILSELNVSFIYMHAYVFVYTDIYTENGLVILLTGVVLRKSY